MTPIEHGHFTTMQVRRRAVQGLHLHLQRLVDATRELFDVELQVSRVRADMVATLDAQRTDDATLRVTVGMRVTESAPAADEDALRIVVTLVAPMVHPSLPLRLASVEHLRTLPHIKHVGTFASHHYRRLAQLGGFDDVLFVDANGRVLEGSFWNIGFWRGDAIVWPEAAVLRGTGERLLQAGLLAAGVQQSSEVVALDVLAGLDGGFIINARGVRGVAGVDGHEWPSGSAGRIARLQALLAAVEWEPLQA